MAQEPPQIQPISKVLFTTHRGLLYLNSKLPLVGMEGGVNIILLEMA